MKKYMLFDLDGTIVESEEGILNAIQYALNKMGFVERDREKLMSFIGPPLMESFRNAYGMSQEKAEKAIGLYREYYTDKGLFECKVYDGIPKLLDYLKNKVGKTNVLVTLKPQIYAERILEHLDLAQYFSLVVGSELNGDHVKKEDVIGIALEKLGAAPDETVMIGDRKQDIAAAQKYKIMTVGAMYGYGGMMELMNADADYIEATVKSLTFRLVNLW